MSFLKHRNSYFQFSPPKLSGCVPVSKRFFEKALIRSSYLSCYGARPSSFITKISYFLKTFWFQVLISGIESLFILSSNFLWSKYFIKNTSSICFIFFFFLLYLPEQINSIGMLQCRCRWFQMTFQMTIVL